MQVFADDIGHGFHHVIAKHAVEHAHADGRIGIGRDQHVCCGMMMGDVFDDCHRFEQQVLTITQHRKRAERPGRADDFGIFGRLWPRRAR
ncbi:MAG: hypothetical protein P8Y48_07160 [Novosphingobium sp.]